MSEQDVEAGQALTAAFCKPGNLLAALDAAVDGSDAVDAVTMPSGDTPVSGDDSLDPGIYFGGGGIVGQRRPTIVKRPANRPDRGPRPTGGGVARPSGGGGRAPTGGASRPSGGGGAHASGGGGGRSSGGGGGGGGHSSGGGGGSSGGGDHKR